MTAGDQRACEEENRPDPDAAGDENRTAVVVRQRESMPERAEEVERVERPLGGQLSGSGTAKLVDDACRFIFGVVAAEGEGATK